ncbi:MAG: hypothetical protein C0483_18205 [Pirellula sp.]|nr:hypothetical protein [Pirellula sp.]
MRYSIVGFAIAECLVAIFPANPARSASPIPAVVTTGVWRTIVLDGLPEAGSAATKLGRRRPSPVIGEIPGMEPHVWSNASWKLQLGMTSLPYVARSIFGPNIGIPLSGDFNGDGHDELAVFDAGKWYLDFNGNSIWDTGDFWLQLGSPGDRPVVGDWDQDGKSDIGVFSATIPTRAISPRTSPSGDQAFGIQFLMNKDLDLAAQIRSDLLICTSGTCLRQENKASVFHFGRADHLPVVGDWRGTGAESIGTFHDGTWLLDIDCDGRPSVADQSVSLGQVGDLPIVGDFNLDGTDELGIYRRGFWHLDTTGDQRLGDDDRSYRFGDENDVPVVGDWDGDGRDQIGIIVVD